MPLAAPPLPPAEIVRGAAAVGDRTSAEPALRAEPQPSAGFRIGAAYRAWRNATAAVRYDATHTTGDGGDAEALAISCGDERLAFAALRSSADGQARAVVAAAGDPAERLAEWQSRRNEAPAACH